ncbi:MAG: hydantoinase B/oxoprolinase family protein [Deltaproteobacteria bacterium]|nr:hydantoinase B/oxoprolinase family protein [Deltaproteobacteria bacterium]MBW2044340.1 hydantoinase B/oxoprolinase family protein [Deltaproteobacteria bacterium]MBW2301275.1 hydantoinase B/oxoprolinase family protein [Deltaproteobacteria bacterium]
MGEEIIAVTREIIANRLNYLTQEMGLSLAKTAYSVLFAENRDFSCAIFDREGYLLALGSFVPTHQGGMQGSMEYVLDKWGSKGLQDGDIFMHNDALHKGSHCQDITLFKPIFFDETHVATGCCVAHHNDTGGMRPRSYCPDAEEIYQEGIRFPAVKLFKRGELQQDILDIYMTNVRMPDSERGDLYAQLSTLSVAEKAIKELCERYGSAEKIINYFRSIQDHAEGRMREGIKSLKEGDYEAESYVDHDGWEEKSWKIKVTVSVKHKPQPHLIIDYSGSDPQARGFVNSYFYNTRANAWAAVYTVVDPYVHKCYGSMRPVEFNVPMGTIVNAKPPAPIGACTTESGFVAADVVALALGKARPQIATGVWGGSFGGLGIYGENPRHHKNSRIKERWASGFTDAGGVGGGARATKDGIGTVTDICGGPITIPNVEIMEANFPVTYRYRKLVSDGGGPGKFRGSPGYEVAIQPEGPMHFTCLCNKGYHGAEGIFGGKEGSRWKLEIRDAETDSILKELPPKVVLHPISPMEIIHINVPGGGGYGHPFERDPERVKEDVIEGYVSIDMAKKDYGVVINPETLEIDVDTTEKLRHGKGDQ